MNQRKYWGVGKYRLHYEKFTGFVYVEKREGRCWWFHEAYRLPKWVRRLV